MDVPGGMVADDLALRDRWIAGLLECGGSLVAIGPLTEVRAPDGSQVLLVLSGDRETVAGQLVEAHKRGVLHVVFVGGEPDPALERTAAKMTPVSQLRRRLGFHH